LNKDVMASTKIVKLDCPFASGAQVRWGHDANLGWSRLANGGLDVHILPCYHEHMLREPHVRVVAEHLRDSLLQAMVRDRT
jgi:thioesterase domain-containing protein